MRHIISTIPALLLMSCSDAGPKGERHLKGPDNTVSLRATADIVTPEEMQKAAFLPNPITPSGSSFSLNLPGEIILLSENGVLWRTTTDGEAPTRIAKGPFIDISGAPRQEEHTAFLALEPGGQLSAFKKTDDVGTYAKLIVSQSNETVKALCSFGQGVVSQKGMFHPLKLLISNDNVAEIEIGTPINGLSNISRCDANAAAHTIGAQNKALKWYSYADSHWTELPALSGSRTVSNVGDDIFLGMRADAPSPLVIVGEKISSLSIESGLSIMGIENTSFITSTPMPMGSVFSGGLILAGDKDSARLVMISMDYAKRELTLDQ